MITMNPGNRIHFSKRLCQKYNLFKYFYCETSYNPDTGMMVIRFSKKKKGPLPLNFSRCPGSISVDNTAMNKKYGIVVNNVVELIAAVSVSDSSVFVVVGWKDKVKKTSHRILDERTEDEYQRYQEDGTYRR